jgi:hypothetical protein
MVGLGIVQKRKCKEHGEKAEISEKAGSKPLEHGKTSKSTRKNMKMPVKTTGRKKQD